jgi:hypothetical protein
MDDIGVPRPEHLAYAAALLAAIPPPLLQAVRGETGAQAIVLALLLDASDTVRNAQLDYLQRHAGDAVMAALGELEPQMAGLPPETRLPLAELAVSALRHTDAETYRSFRDAVETLATTDREVDLFEYVLYRMILRRLAPSFEPAASPPPARHALAPLLPHCGELLSCLVAIARPDQAGRETAFAAAAAKLAPAGTLRLRNPGRCPVAALDRALAPLAEAAPRIKKRVLDACVTAAAADGTATADEAMLLQAVADALDCPMPPILPGQDI